MSTGFLMAFSYLVESRFNGNKVRHSFLGVPGSDLADSIRSSRELADFKGAVCLDRGEMCAGDTRVIDHADLHRVGGKAGELAIFPGLNVTAANAEAGIHSQRAFLPCGRVDDFCPDTNLLQLVHKFERYKFSHRAGRMHLPHVAQRLAISGCGNLVTPGLEERLGRFIVEDLAFFIHDLCGGNAPALMAGFIDFGKLSEKFHRSPQEEINTYRGLARMNADQDQKIREFGNWVSW